MNRESILRIQDLQFRWPSGQQDVLNIERLTIERGEKVFLEGQSGSGKTTLLGLVGGINVANRGEVELLGKNLSKLKQGQRDQFRADHIGFIFQLFNLIPYLSVTENITLACKFSKARAQRARLKSGSLEAEARRLLSHLNLDIDAIIDQPVRELSVGQQQRVAAARALIGAPELVIADEPTSALDADAREHFLQLMLRECESSGSTVLFVSHDRSLQAGFDRSVALAEINRATGVQGRDTERMMS